ncbi:MAG: response regulator [Planctomycetota bacterium]|nr:MAG: response regulator [Planctomycetota bacterium]
MHTTAQYLEGFDAAQRGALQREAHAYSVARSRDALFIYAALCGLIGLVTSYAAEHPVLFGIVTALALLSGVVRWRIAARFEPAWEDDPKRWRRHWVGWTILTALLWGGFCALVLTSYGLDWLGMLLVLTATVLCTSFLSSHAPHLGLTRGYVVAICGPIIVAGLLARPPHGELLSLMLVLFVLYNWRQAARVHDSYWQAAANRMLLEVRAEQLERARLRAEQASRAKSRFLSNVSHELRTPLNAVLGMLAQLLDSVLSPPQREAVQQARRSATELLGLIDDLLDASRLEAGTMELAHEPFDPVALLYEVAEGAAARAWRKGLEIVVDYDVALPDRVVGDPLRVRQALVHLVSNAVKFTERGHVLLEARLEQLDPTEVRLRLRVSDTGPGIPASAQQQVFERFHQLDASPARRHGGTGIGLAIARDLAHLMDGKLEIERSDPSGSVLALVLRLPWSRERNQSGPTPAGDLQGLRIAVADRCRASRDAIAARLRFWGAEVCGFDATERLLAAGAQAASRGEPFDLVIWDCALDGGCPNATLLAERLRDTAWGGEVGLVLLLTPDCEPEPAALAALELEAALRKPVRLDRLYEVLAVFRARRNRAGRVAPEAALGRLHVLVAEDNPVNRKVAVRMLEKLGHRCDVAADGREALERLAAGRYDLVLMDCQMPGVDGFEATRRLRAREGDGPRTPVVAMTAHTGEEDRRRCLAAGMDGFLTKPLDAARLEAALEHGRRRSEHPAAPRPSPPPTG